MIKTVRKKNGFIGNMEEKMKLIRQFIKGHKSLTIKNLIVLTLQVFGTLYVPFLVARLINEGVSSGNLNKVFYIGTQMLAFALMTGLISILASYFTAQLSAVFSKEMTGLIFQKVQTLSVSDMNKFGVASLLTRTISDVENVAIVMVLFLQMIVPAPIMSIIAIVMTQSKSAILVWVPIIVILFFSVVVMILMHFGNKYSAIVQQKTDHIMRAIREFYTGIRVIRAFDNEAVEKSKTDASFKDYADNMIILNKIFAWMTPTVNVLLSGAMVAILWFGAFEIGSGDIQVGSLTAVVGYVVLTIMYLFTAAMVLITLPNAIASIHRIQEVLDYNPEIKDVNQQTALTIDSHDSEILVEFNHVTFSYPEAETAVLNDINFKLKRGQTLAIVGSTGSGKSTIAKLLLRFNDISSGSIRVDGVDIRKFSQQELRQRISYVPQKAFLFSGTVWDNLVYGAKDALVSDVEKATKISQANSFIKQLPANYQAAVSQGGVNFSGGQRQRLSIARALVKPADVYIFDDSFSALDYKTDALIRRALKEEMQDATMIIVAQRLSTITEADNIILLNEGQLVGIGKHEELLAGNSYYREIAISQQLVKEDTNNA